MLPIKGYEQLYKEQERKLKYLLGKSEDPWLLENKAKLDNLINLFANLSNEGLSQDDLFNQFMHTNDMLKYNEIKDIIAEEYLNTENDANPSLLSFEHGMYSQMQEHRSKLKESVDKDYTTNIMRTGLIRVTTQPNKMFALKNDILLETRNEITSLKIAIDEAKYYYHLVINNNIYELIFEYDDIIGLQKTTKIANYFDHYIEYTLNDDNYYLSFYNVKIDINNHVVDIIKSTGNVTIKQNDFLDLASNLPLNIAIYTVAFQPTTEDPFESFKTSLIRKQLDSVNDQIIRNFNDTYAKDISYGLYGQGAMIGVSQVYELAKTAIRAVKTEYDIKTKPYLETYRLPESFPPFADIIKDPMKNKIDLIGNSIMPDKGAFTSTNLWQIRIERSAMPTMLNYQEIGGKVMSGYNIATDRLTVTKGELNRYLSDGTIGKAKYWVENVVNITSINSAQPVYKAKTSKGICDVTFDACLEVPEYSYTVHGVRINLHSSGLTESETVTIYNGYRLTTVANSTLRLIIWPDDLATEGSSNTQITLSYTIRGSPKTITSVAVKQLLAYGDTQISAYVVNLENSTGQFHYIVGNTFEARVENTDVEVFVNRNDNGFGSSSRTVKSLMYPKLTTVNDKMIANNRTGLVSGSDLVPGRGVRPAVKERLIANSDYQLANTQVLTSQNAPWSMPAQNVDAVSWINFNSSISCETGVDWKDITMVRKFSGYDSQTTPTNIPDLKYYLSDGEHKANWTLLKVNWTTPFPSINKNAFNAMVDSSIINANFVLTDISFIVEEVVLPAGVLNQGVIAESIINLQRAVEYLQNYASYLSYLIENLDARLTQVEETLQQVVDVLTTMLNGKKGILGIISDVVGFIGTGVGMFFPLIGLGITIVGQILKGADEINEGDIVTGSMDIVIGGVMAALGIKKWNQRLKRKYGQQQELPTPNDGLPSYEEAMNSPGYGVVSIRRDVDPFAYGAARNVWYDFSGDTLIIHGDVYPNSNMRNTSHDIPSSIKVTGVETWLKSSVVKSQIYVQTDISFEANMLQTDEHLNVVKKRLNNTDLVYLLGIDVDIQEYCLILYLYGTGTVNPFSKETSFDPDNLDILMISNGIVMTGTTSRRTLNTLTQRKIVKKSKNVVKKWILKYKSKKRNDEVQMSSPITSIATLFSATNPIIQSSAAQELLFKNLYYNIIPYINQTPNDE